MAGVYDQRKQIIPLISPANYEAVAAQIGASGGVDVTGGMATKVRDMIALATAVPGLDIRGSAWVGHSHLWRRHARTNFPSPAWRKRARDAHYWR